jgi:hypothetical protein
MRKTERFEDMSPDGKLTVLIEDDGDIIIEATTWTSPTGGRLFRQAQVQFCTCGSGGGQSPETRKALLSLFDAIQRDNETNKQHRT